jgi:hypothetical protein
MSLLHNYITHEPEEEYHARSKSGEMLSSHMLARFCEMPYKYHATITGEYQEPGKPEYAFGTAAHKMILEGLSAFNETYIVSDGPFNERTGKVYGKDTKAYQDWLSAQTGEVITIQDFDEITKMAASINKHPEITEKVLLPGGIAEGVVRAEIEGVPCQIRMDYFHPETGIVDLKTCRDIRFFEYDMRSFGYAFQMAFYRAVLRAASGTEYPVHMIAVDKTDFHVSGYWSIPAAELDVAERINAAAIRRLKECRETGKWPTGYERKQIFTLNK